MSNKIAAMAIALSLSAIPPARGQCNIYRQNVPDFDQIRAALPNSGNMYCVPTSATNWMAYISNNGLPAVLGGPFNWQSASVYDYVTTHIDYLGDEMKTSATGGTGGGDARDGLSDVLWDRAPFVFTVNTWYGYVRIPDLYDLMADNRLTMLCYGYYKPDANGRYARDGGHCISLTGLENACGSNPVVRFRDPADDSTDTSQSTFTSRVSNAELRTLPTSSGNITRWRLSSLSPSSTTLRCIDRHVTIRTRFAIWASAVNGSFIRQDLINSIHAQGGTLSTFTTGNNLPVNEGVLSPDGLHIYYTTASEAVFDPIIPLYRQRLATGQAQRLATLDSHTPMVFDRFGALYFYRFGRIRKYDLSSGNLVEVASFQPALGTFPEAMAWDDARDQLVVLLQGSGNRTMQLLSRTLAGLGSYPLPTSATTSGQLRFDIIPSGGFVVGSTASGVLHNIRFNNILPRLDLTQSFSAAGATGVRAIQISEQGYLCAMTSAGVREFERNGTTGQWQSVAAPRFGTLPASPIMVLSRGRTNFDPLIHNTPEWNDVLVPEPTPVPIRDCPADQNLDGAHSVGDLFLFLQRYFGGERTGDFNESGVISVQDIFDFLAAYFAGCA